MSRNFWRASVAAAVLAVAGASLADAAPTGGFDSFAANPQMIPTSAEAMNQRCEAGLALAASLQKAMETDKSKATVASVFKPFDDLNSLLSDMGGEIYLVSETNPDKAIRAAAEACVQKVSDFGSQLQVSRPIYDRLLASPKAGLDATTAHLLDHQLLEARLAGVALDPATRAKVIALQQKITATGLKFDGNIRDLKGDTPLDPADLTGLPADYIAAHRPGADGKVHISTDYPDVFPILDFAEKESTRRAVYMTFTNRAWPQNGPVLKELIAERDEYAKLLGYPDYAALALADKMVGTPSKALSFLRQVNDAATPGAQKDYGELLARWKQIDPTATSVPRYNGSYLQRLLRKEKYQADSAVIRQYFTYTKARDGIFQLVHDLFGSEIRPWNTPVWAKGVTAWEVYDKGKLIGRFYLDPYPRAGKYSHAATFPIRNGIAGRMVPVGALVTNFPETGPMEHDDVTTFLHEFGHLIHGLYSNQQRWGLATMGNLEWDFIEAPSQFLEEWTWDYDTLSRFATNAQGQPIPRDLVEKMNRARKFGQGIEAKGQIAYSAISLDFYSQPPAALDLDADYQAQQKLYSVYPYIPNTHAWANFGHLNGYSAYYYTYIWSKALALDLFTRFQKAGMRDPATAMAYRKLVLEPGSAVPADKLVTDFLGRPFSLDAYRVRLEGK
jgi:thimet oligopeptidase